jgi:hypothetical protein
MKVIVSCGSPFRVQGTPRAATSYGVNGWVPAMESLDFLINLASFECTCRDLGLVSSE